MLDHRVLRTPARHPLVLPSRALALAIAAEWEWQVGAQPVEHLPKLPPARLVDPGTPCCGGSSCSHPLTTADTGRPLPPPCRSPPRQIKRIQPFTMPLMSLAATALDEPKPRDEVVATMLQYLPTDSVLCRDEAGLVADRQAQARVSSPSPDCWPWPLQWQCVSAGTAAFAVLAAIHPCA